jgi:tetratricopeptide (TPR) repeat protein
MNTSDYTYEQFIACKWKYDTPQEKHYGYSSVMQSLQECAEKKTNEGLNSQAEILELLSRSSSMMLTPSSLNEPFKPRYQDFQTGKRSAIPEDFTSDELDFFVTLLKDIDEPWLKARLADLLWLIKTPKKPDHARIAIDTYISHAIDSETWHKDIKSCWERAARLAMQIKDFDKLDEIKNQLFAAFGIEYPNSKFMPLWLADLMDRLNIDHDFREDIATNLFRIGKNQKNIGDFNAARSYFELAAKKFHQCKDDQGWLDSLISIASCFEQEADSRTDSNMVANSFYENAIQAYRNIPTKHRATYDIENKIQSVRKKVVTTGEATLDEMGLITTPRMDISDLVESSIAHVSGKQSLEEALMYFTGIYGGPEISKLSSIAQEMMQQSPISSLFGSSHMSSDGRVIAKTPAANLGAGDDDPANQAVLNRQIQQQFAIEVQIIVEGQILPALRQLLVEHRVTKEKLESACHLSPIVPQNREKLLGHALWNGFDYDFGNAIHLLCPQVEHIVRTQLKNAGVHTSNIDQDGIENENGLSTLMDLPEATQVFGDDLAFEIKSIFTEPLGSNLRNEVAHGLLDDRTSSSVSIVYAWWMVLRLVIRSIRDNVQRTA